MIGTLAITFDWEVNSNDVWFELINRGFNASYYVAPENIDQNGGPTLGQLILLKQSGIEIGPYTNTNMQAMHLNNRNTAFDKLKSLYDALDAKGFKSETLAPNERRWNPQLANMARGLYKGIRVASGGSPIQSYPIADKLNVTNGVFASLGTATPLQDVKDYVDAVAMSNGLGILVIHGVRPVADPYALAMSDYIALLDYIATKGLRVPRFVDALEPA